MTFCAAHVRFWTKADKVSFWLDTFCPLMTQSEHAVVKLMV